MADFITYNIILARKTQNTNVDLNIKTLGKSRLQKKTFIGYWSVICNANEQLFEKHLIWFSTFVFIEVKIQLITCRMRFCKSEQKPTHIYLHKLTNEGNVLKRALKIKELTEK